MSNLKVVIVEDDPISIEVLKDSLDQISLKTVILGCFGTVKEAKSALNDLNFDILFLDIQLKDGQGFEILKDYDGFEFGVIVTTSFDSYMLDAIKYSAIDYLIKPIEKENLEDAINRYVNQKKLLLERINQLSSKMTLSVHADGGIRFLNLFEIIRLESEGSYTTIELKNGESILTSKHLGHYENKLESYGFVRVHNSHIVNKNYVKRLLNQDGGILELIDHTQVPVSRRKKKAVLALLEE
jgi:two-component system LytT family response regulator